MPQMAIATFTAVQFLAIILSAAKNYFQNTNISRGPFDQWKHDEG